MPNAQGPGLCSTSVDKKDDHVCSMLVHVVCCNLIRVFFFLSSMISAHSPKSGEISVVVSRFYSLNDSVVGLFPH